MDGFDSAGALRLRQIELDRGTDQPGQLARPSLLDPKQPDPPLQPLGLVGLARTLENWGHQVVEERIWRGVVTQVPNVLADPRERWTFEEMQTRSRGRWHVLKARRSEFVRELMPYFGLVDQMLEGRDWILSRPTLADFGIFGGSPLG